MHLPLHAFTQLLIQILTAMKYHIKYIALAMMLIIATSCIKDVTFSGEETTPKLVVNGLQIVGETPNLCIEKSWFFLSSEPDIKVKGLSVKLFVNDTFVEDLMVMDSCTINENGYYYGEPHYKFSYCYGTYIYQEGDKVRFEVISDEFDPTEISITMPGQPEVLDFDTTRVEGIYYPSYEEDPNFYWEVDSQGNPCSLQYQDYYDEETQEWIAYYDTIYPGQLNYNKVYFNLSIANAPEKEYFNFLPMEGFYSDWGLHLYSSDPVFNSFEITSFIDNEYSANTEYNVFSDALFQGDSYTLSFYSDYVYYGCDDKHFVIDLHYIDENYFKYLQSYDAYNNSDLGELTYLISEPIQIYSNVKGGIGIVGAMGRATTAEITIASPDYKSVETTSKDAKSCVSKKINL